MGLVEKILSFKKVDKVSTFYSDYLSIELAEDFHIHFRNSRIEMDADEFDTYCKAIKQARLKWVLIGKPKVGDVNNVGKQIFLCQSKINEQAGNKNNAVNSEEIRVELQKWADYVHIHYKWLRLEFSIDEFLEFAHVINESTESIASKVDLRTTPRRIGKHHAACPRGRVDRKFDTDFWTDVDQDIDLDHRHKTVFFDKKDDELQNNKSKKKNIKIQSHNWLTRLLLRVIERSKILSTLAGIRIS